MARSGQEGPTDPEEEPTDPEEEDAVNGTPHLSLPWWCYTLAAGHIEASNLLRN